MTMFHRRPGLRTKIAAVGATAAVAATAGWVVTAIDGAGSASAATKNTAAKNTAAKNSGTKPAAHSAKKGLLRRADHATFEVDRHGRWVTVTLDRGKVAAVSASSITLDRPDGHAVTVKLGPSTRYRGVASSSSTVATGRRATVVSENGTALGVTEAKSKK